MRPCKNCKGKGRFKPKYTKGMVDCPYCSGTGKVQNARTTTVLTTRREAERYAVNIKQYYEREGHEAEVEIVQVSRGIWSPKLISINGRKLFDAD